MSKNGVDGVRIKGIEPLNNRTKNECLTAWRYPKTKYVF